MLLEICLTAPSAMPTWTIFGWRLLAVQTPSYQVWPLSGALVQLGPFGGISVLKPAR